MKRCTLLLALVLWSGAAQAQMSPAGLSPYAQLEASAGVGYLGKEDSVDVGTAKVYFTAPKGWIKEANVDVSNGQFFYFLRYRPSDKDYQTVIFLTGIKVGPEDTDVLAYTKKIIAGLRQKSPDNRIEEPRPVMFKKIPGAYFERTSAKDKSFWARYQFLVGGRVLKLQLTSQG